MYKQLKEKIEKSRYGRPRIANNTWARFKERSGRPFEEGVMV